MTIYIYIYDLATLGNLVAQHVGHEFVYWLGWIYGIPTSIAYLKPNPVYIYIYILLFVGWLFGFYGISTFVGYLTPNSVYIYIHIQPKISKRILR